MSDLEAANRWTLVLLVRVGGATELSLQLLDLPAQGSDLLVERLALRVRDCPFRILGFDLVGVEGVEVELSSGVLSVIG